MASQKMMGKYKVLKAVTLSVLKQKKDTEYYIKINSPMILGKEIDGGKTVDANGNAIKKKEPAHVCEVTDLETGEQHIWICATVFRKEMQEQFPGDTYVGKCFAVSFTKIEGKDYNIYTIVQIAEPEDEAEEAPKGDEAKAPGKTAKK